MLTSMQDSTIDRFYPGFYPEEKEIATDIDMLMVVIPISNRTTTWTNYPYIEIAQMTGGPSAVIRGTRIPVSVIAGYLSMGETVQTIADEILPHLTRAQVQDAKQYYGDHRAEIDRERKENTEAAAQQYLKETLGNEKYRQITGA